MGQNTKFPGKGLQSVTAKELNALFDEQCPVIHRGITYQRVSAIIRRRDPDKPRAFLQVELIDKTGRSVTIADPGKVERSAQQ